ncbi:hypothetical protein [Poriferisphaera sp. WC338]|uniref:hypothetical protein n=1 Tax=Poriferisphaera sp. WC338 TaxID=3425129 RepID=UPI003D81C0D5
MADQPTPVPNQTNDDAETASKAKAFATPGSLLRLSFVCLVCSAFLLTLAIMAIETDRFGIYSVEAPQTPAMQVVQTFLVFLPAVVLCFAGTVTLIVGSIRLANGASNTTPAAGSQDELLASLGKIHERLLLSDTAKRIAYRHHDIEALRKTIRADIANHNFDAALALVTEMSRTYGYLEESENFRDQINAARRADMEMKITKGIAQIETVIEAHDFELAMQGAQKLIRLFPESERAKSMPDRVRAALDDYKHQLEREFIAAADKDVDRAHDLMVVLDKYLTADEAEPLREIARGVIGKKRDNLGVQFKMAVHEKDDARAVRVGEQIIRDFPNTRMADEVRSVIDKLRERAAAQQATQSAY